MSDLISKLAAIYGDELLEALLDPSLPPEDFDASDDRLRQVLADNGVAPGKDTELALAQLFIEIFGRAMAGEPH